MSKRLTLLLVVLAVSVVVAVALEVKYTVFTGYFTDSRPESVDTVATSTPSIFDAKPAVKSVIRPEEVPVKEMPEAKEYVRVEGNGFNNASLYLSPVKDGKVDFYIEAVSGVNTGEADGTAELSSTESSRYVFKDDNQKGCEVVLTGIGTDTVNVVATNSCWHGGLGVRLDGDYKFGAKNPERSIDWIFKRDSDLKAFNTLVGTDKQKFSDTAQLLSDSFEGAGTKEVYSLYLNGLGGLAGSIVIIDTGSIWAAVLVDSEVWYYTNVPADKLRLEATIEKWADSNVKSYTVVYKTP